VAQKGKPQCKYSWPVNAHGDTMRCKRKAITDGHCRKCLGAGQTPEPSLERKETRLSYLLKHWRLGITTKAELVELKALLAIAKEKFNSGRVQEDSSR
jgi:hypothetical protein